jgi:crossover junction endodeoxyribonuclease RuvC
MSELIVVGADPGLKGGVAGLRVVGQHSEWLFGFRMPLMDYRGRQQVDARRLRERLHECWELTEHEVPHAVVVEQVSAMPQQGVTSSFRFGQATGMLQAVLGIVYNQSMYTEITPAVWKKAMGLSANKGASMDHARRLWPSQFEGRPKADDGIAEAGLLAHWWGTHNG